MKLLSRAQKTTLVMMARKAFDHVAQRAQAGYEFDSSSAAFDVWRRERVMHACGKPGLRECGNDDYLPIAAEFQSLEGRDDLALNSLVRAQNQKYRQVETVLQRTLASADLPAEYAEAISLRRFKCPIEDLTEDQILQLLWTVKARARSKIKRLEALTA
jgi:hypothetical protein